MYLDLKSLSCVDALARTLSFHRAARACALSPAAFGKRIRQIEEQLDKELFSRTTRRVELTPDGARLLPKARQLLASADGLLTEVRGEEPPIDLVIGTRHELGMSWLLPARKVLKSRLPHVTIHLAFGHRTDLESAVLALQTDACVISRTPSTTRLSAFDLHREDYAFVASPQLLAEVAFAEPSDAEKHVLVDIDQSLSLYRYLRPEEGELRFRSVLTMGTIDAIRTAVLGGEGVAMLPLYFIKQDLAAGRLLSILPNTAIATDTFRLIFRSDDPQRDLMRRLADVLRGVALR